MKCKMMIILVFFSVFGVFMVFWVVDYLFFFVNSWLIGQNQYWMVQEGDCNLQVIVCYFDIVVMLIFEVNDMIVLVQLKFGI